MGRLPGGRVRGGGAVDQRGWGGGEGEEGEEGGRERREGGGDG